jgi:hypothetical protein
VSECNEHALFHIGLVQGSMKSGSASRPPSPRRDLFHIGLVQAVGV